MSEFDEALSSEDTPVEEAAVPSQEDEAVKETDESSPGESGTSDADGEPSVVQDDKQQSAYDAMQSRARQAEAVAQQREQELAEYRRKEKEAIDEKYKDEDEWARTVLSHADFVKYQRGEITQAVTEALATRDQQMQYMQEQERGQKAGADLREFAYKEAKMKPEQLGAFLREFSRPDTMGNMVPFLHYTPEQALEMAKSIIRDRHFPEFQRQTKESANREADMKKKELLKRALPGGSPPGGPGAPATAEEAYKAMVTGPRDQFNANEWLQS